MNAKALNERLGKLVKLKSLFESAGLHPDTMRTAVFKGREFTQAEEVAIRKVLLSLQADVNALLVVPVGESIREKQRAQRLKKIASLQEEINKLMEGEEE